MKRNRKKYLSDIINRAIDSMIELGCYSFNDKRIPTTQDTACRLRDLIAQDFKRYGDEDAWLQNNIEICRFYDSNLDHEELTRLRVQGGRMPGIMYALMPTTLVAHRLMRPLTDAVRYSHYARMHLQNAVRDRRCIYRESLPRPSSFIERVKKWDLTPKAFRYNRAIAVEIEGFAPVGAIQLAKQLPIWARAGTDGSIRVPSSRLTGHEIKALFPRELMEPRLYKLCTMLNSIDFRVNRSCGLHVHIDRRGMSMPEVIKLGRRVDKWIEQLIELFPLSRRDNTYCKGGIAAGDRYRRVNVSAFSKYETLEFRIHSGTCNYTKILMWIRLIELLMAMPKPPKAADTLQTLAQLPLPENDRAYWLRRHREINPHLYNEAPSATNDALNTEE